MRPIARCSVSLSAFLLVAPAGALPLGPAPPGSEVPLERARLDRLAVTISIAGERMVWSLDTGATLSMIAAPLARRLALACAEALTVTDAAGRSRPACAGGPVELELGTERLRLGEVGWFPDGQGFYEREGLGGVLGADALAGLDVALDPVAGRARLAPAGALAAWYEGESVAVSLVAGRPALEVVLRDLGRRPVVARLVLDTGSDRTILFGGLARRLAAARAGHLGAATLASAHASRGVDLAPVGRCAAGGQALRLGKAVLLPAVADRVEDGLVPLDAVGPLLLELGALRARLGARLRSAPAGELLARSGP